MSMKIVTEVSRKYNEFKDIIMIENEVICIDRRRQRAIAAKMNANDVLRVLRHLTALALEELEWRNNVLIKNLKGVIRKIDDLVSAASGGVFYERYEAIESMEAIIKELEHANELYDEITEALNAVGNMYEHLQEIYDKIPDLLILYTKSYLW